MQYPMRIGVPIPAIVAMRVDSLPAMRESGASPELGVGLCSRVVECAQGALLGRIIGAQLVLRGRSRAQRPWFSGRLTGRSDYLLS